MIRSLTPQQAARNALAAGFNPEKTILSFVEPAAGYLEVNFAQYHGYNPIPEKQIAGSPFGMHCGA
jgi:hypothetical protein